MSWFFKKEKISQDEQEWLDYVGTEQYYKDEDYMQGKRDNHYSVWGHNSVGGIDVEETFNELISRHLLQFTKGANFPSKYTNFYNAQNSDGYEIAKYETVLNCRKTMIEDHRYCENPFGQRQISLQGLDILAQCQAYDVFLRNKRIEENQKHQKFYSIHQKHRKELYSRDAKVVQRGNLDTKRVERDARLYDFIEATEAPSKSLWGFLLK